MSNLNECIINRLFINDDGARQSSEAAFAQGSKQSFNHPLLTGKRFNVLGEMVGRIDHRVWYMRYTLGAMGSDKYLKQQGLEQGAVKMGVVAPKCVEGCHVMNLREITDLDALDNPRDRNFIRRMKAVLKTPHEDPQLVVRPVQFFHTTERVKFRNGQSFQTGYRNQTAYRKDIAADQDRVVGRKLAQAKYLKKVTPENLVIGVPVERTIWRAYANSAFQNNFMDEEANYAFELFRSAVAIETESESQWSDIHSGSTERIERASHVTADYAV